MHATEAEVWASVLECLPSRTLAVVACVCRTFRGLASALRARDVACGTENALLLAPTAADAAALRASFTYVRICTGAALDGEEAGDGCDCCDCFSAAACATPACACAAHDLECGPACRCTLQPASCPQRVSQQPISRRLSLFHDALRGWGLISEADVPNGAFVCIYAGVLLEAEEACRKLAAQDARAAQCNYILLLREHFAGGSVMVTAIDPTSSGNAGRFLNHACDGGNLDLRIVRMAGCPVPHAAFFARRRIRAGEELTYSYGVPREPTASGAKLCCCGTAACKGALPFDDA